MTRRPQWGTKRPYFPNGEVETWAVRELEELSLLPDSPAPVRIERFVERRFEIGAVLYDELPPGVLGYTVFDADGVTEVVVSRSLVEKDSKVADRRVRTTLAHEAGHGLMHAPLFTGDDKALSLFDEDSDVTGQKILCRDEASGPRYQGRWWEFQANMMMAALLLPRPLVHAAVGRLATRSGMLGPTTLPPQERHAAALLVSELFDVNPVVARYRLDGLFPSSSEGQLTL